MNLSQVLTWALDVGAVALSISTIRQTRRNAREIRNITQRRQQEDRYPYGTYH